MHPAPSIILFTVLSGMGVSLNTTYTATNGRPMKIAGGGKIISGLLA